MMPKGLIALKPNSSRARQQWLRGVFLLCVVGVGWGTEALACASAQNYKPLSTEALEKELKQYKTISALQARFEQIKKLKDADVAIKSSGDLSLKSEAGKSVIDWIVRKPAFLQLHITESSLELSQDPNTPGKPIVDSKDAQAKILRPIYAWLSMNSALIEEQFNVTRCGSLFNLTPKAGKDSPLARISMGLDKDGLVRGVTLLEKSGDSLKITFLDTKVTKLKDAPAK